MIRGYVTIREGEVIRVMWCNMDPSLSDIIEAAKEVFPTKKFDDLEVHIGNFGKNIVLVSKK